VGNIEKAAMLQKCSREFDTLLFLANIFLWAALATAVAISILAIVERLAALKTKAAVAEVRIGGVSTFLDALKGLVAALAAAPPWYAIFLAGLLLLWFSDRFVPTHCGDPSSSAKEATSAADGSTK
jgi:hypothetical protein